jgi:hypothetical protein
MHLNNPHRLRMLFSADVMVLREKRSGPVMFFLLRLLAHAQVAVLDELEGLDAPSDAEVQFGPGIFQWRDILDRTDMAKATADPPVFESAGDVLRLDAMAEAVRHWLEAVCDATGSLDSDLAMAPPARPAYLYGGPLEVGVPRTKAAHKR